MRPFLLLICFGLLVSTVVQAKKSKRRVVDDFDDDDAESLDAGPKQSYAFEMSLDKQAHWIHRGDIHVQLTNGALSFEGSDSFTWDAKILGEMKEAPFIALRARSLRDKKDSGGQDDSPTVIVSVCAFVTTSLRSGGRRGASLYFEELYNIMTNPARNHSVLGLQLPSKGLDELCDVAVFDAISSSAQPLRQEIRFTKMTSWKPKLPVPQEVYVPVAGKKAKSGKEAPEEDNRGFLQKYWWVFLIMLAVNFLFAGGAQPQQQQQEGGGGTRAQ